MTEGTLDLSEAQVARPYAREFPAADDGLDASLEAHGQLQEGVVSGRTVDGKYVLLQGHRRAECLFRRGRTIRVRVKADVKTADAELVYLVASDPQRPRHDLEVGARILDWMAVTGRTQAEAAGPFGLHPSKVSRLLAPFKLHASVLAAYRAREINLSHVAVLRKCKDDAGRAELLERVRRQGLTADAARALAAPRRAKRGAKMATLSFGGCVLSYPPAMSVERFEVVLAELKTAVSDRLRDVSKKSLKLAEVAG